MKSTTIYINILLLILTFFDLKAQETQYIQYTTKDGLPTNYVYGVIEDTDGYIWAYTERGLAKFDGYKFHNFTTKDGLPGNDVIFAQRGPMEKVWLSIYNSKPAYLYKDSIHIISDDQCVFIGFWDYEPYYTCSDKLIKFQRDSLFEIKLKHNIPYHLTKKYSSYLSPIDSLNPIPPKRIMYTFDSLKQSTVYLQGNLIVPPNKDLMIFHNGEKVIYKNVEGNWQELTLDIPKISITGIIQLPNKKEFFFTSKNNNNNIYWIDIEHNNHRIISVHDYGLFPKAHINVSLQDDFFWVNTDVGALCFDYKGNLLEKVILNNLNQQFLLLRNYKDKAGNTWIGSRDGGLIFIPQSYKRIKRRKHFNKQEKHFEQLIATNSGNILGITANTGIYHIKRDTIIELLAPERINRFRTAINTPIGIIISSSRNSLLLKDNLDIRQLNKEYKIDLSKNKFKYHNNKEFLINSTDFTLLEQDKLMFLQQWFVFYLDLNLQKRDINISGTSIISNLIYNHPYQNLTFSVNGNSLNYIERDSSITFLKYHDDFQNISALYGTPNRLWIGTENRGLFYYDFGNEKLNRISDSETINQIRPDAENGIIAATSNGVMVISDEKNPRIKTIYNTLNGLPNNDIEDVFALGDSIIYVASAEGIYEINRHFKPSSDISTDLLSIKDVQVNGKSTELSGLENLSYQQDDISIDFHLRSYASNRQITYSTRLDPIEKEWILSKERNRNYPGLAQGRYTFHLIATNINGKESKHPPISIYIAPAFWQTLWFRLLCVTLFVASVLIIARNRIREAQKRAKAKQNLEKRIATLELDALKAQMNPHFIFNALGAIQYFIQTHEVESADNYLTMFARLMRIYLDSAREKMIPLEQEIELLKNYTALEQMRFEGLFEVEINLAESLNPSNFLIPPMILQPFIENAVNHGLSERKDGNGLIKIYFENNEEDLICTLTDNGIGREKAKRNRRQGHRSRGMKIVSEKIETLHTSGIADIQIDITDAEPKNQMFPGTQVVILIKSLENEDD